MENIITEQQYQKAQLVATSSNNHMAIAEVTESFLGLFFRKTFYFVAKWDAQLQEYSDFTGAITKQEAFQHIQSYEQSLLWDGFGIY